jgi:hypothetical protein
MNRNKFPPHPGPLPKEGGGASLVARVRGKFTPAKPGGICLALKHFLDFRQATLATLEDFGKEIRIVCSASVS